jgi:hypothetical protein
MVSLQILGFRLRVVRYVCWMFMVSLQILGFSVACFSLCVGCLWFPECKF